MLPDQLLLVREHLDTCRPAAVEQDAHHPPAGRHREHSARSRIRDQPESGHPVPVADRGGGPAGPGANAGADVLGERRPGPDETCGQRPERGRPVGVPPRRREPEAPFDRLERGLERRPGPVGAELGGEVVVEVGLPAEVHRAVDEGRSAEALAAQPGLDGAVLVAAGRTGRPVSAGRVRLVHVREVGIRHRPDEALGHVDQEAAPASPRLHQQHAVARREEPRGHGAARGPRPDDDDIRGPGIRMSRHTPTVCRKSCAHAHAHTDAHPFVESAVRRRRDCGWSPPGVRYVSPLPQSRRKRGGQSRASTCRSAARSSAAGSAASDRDRQATCMSGRTRTTPSSSTSRRRAQSS